MKRKKSSGETPPPAKGNAARGKSSGVSPQKNAAPVYIVSGGVGASGEQLVNTVLAQFPARDVPVEIVGNVREIAQVEAVVWRARETGGTIAHTLVEGRLRRALAESAGEQGVRAVDLMGPLLEALAETLGETPEERPGLYRQLHRAYFDRVAAIEYTIAHDDGQNASGWPEADVALVGVSRTGKTPLCIYLSVLGWKAANVPFVPDLGPPSGLLRGGPRGGVEPRRIVGLTIDPDQLLLLREQRTRRLGSLRVSDYIDPTRIREELQAARRWFRESGIAIVDVTDKPIESSASEIIRLLSK